MCLSQIRSVSHPTCRMAGVSRQIHRQRHGRQDGATSPCSLAVRMVRLDSPWSVSEKMPHLHVLRVGALLLHTVPACRMVRWALTGSDALLSPKCVLLVTATVRLKMLRDAVWRVRFKHVLPAGNEGRAGTGRTRNAHTAVKLYIESAEDYTYLMTPLTASRFHLLLPT